MTLLGWISLLEYYQKCNQQTKLLQRKKQRTLPPTPFSSPFPDPSVVFEFEADDRLSAADFRAVPSPFSSLMATVSAVFEDA